MTKVLLALLIFGPLPALAGGARVTITSRNPETGVQQTQDGYIGPGESFGQKTNFPAITDDGARPWLVEISSRYWDDEVKDWATLTGTGSLVEDHGHFYVLTAAHVSQGKNLQIIYHGMDQVPLAVKRITSDSLLDIAWIEVAKPALPSHGTLSQDFAPLAAYDASRDVFRVDSNFTAFWILRARERAPDYRGSQMFPVPGHFIQIDRKAAVPLPSWISAGEWEQKQPLETLARNTLRSTSFDRELVSPVKIAPGTSGAPVLYLDTLTDEIHLVGVTLHVARQFQESFFASPAAIYSLFRKIREGCTGELSSYQWNIRKGLTYRKSPRFSEISPWTRPVAGVLYQNSGHGVYGDSGHGVYGDGGHGVYGDGGHGVYGDGGHGVYGDGGQGLLQSVQQDPWSFFDILPGLLSGNRPFLAVGSTAQGRSPIFADLLASDLFIHDGTPLTGIDADFGSLIQLRFRAPESAFHTGSPSQASLSSDGQKIHVEFLTQSNERVAFDLDRAGRQISPPAKIFLPVITVEASGKSFDVDLRNLFFLEPTEMTSAFDPGQRAYAPLDGAAARLLNLAPSLNYREVGREADRSYDDQRIEFTPVAP